MSMRNYYPIAYPGCKTGPVTNEWVEKVKAYIEDHPLFYTTDIHAHFESSIKNGSQSKTYSRVTRALKILKCENYIVVCGRAEKAIQYKRLINED